MGRIVGHGPGRLGQSTAGDGLAWVVRPGEAWNGAARQWGGVDPGWCGSGRRQGLEARVGTARGGMSGRGRRGRVG